MPYQYRSLTPAQKDDLLQYRREHGYPLHSPPHPFRFSGYYLISAANYLHTPIMADPARRTEFETRLTTEMKESGAEIVAWVVLPNHYHILIGVESFDIITSVLKRLHNGTSYEWNKLDHETGKRKVWYKYYDHLIRDQSQYFQSLNYIHYNPCKHGYVKDLSDWPWSSLSIYYEDFGQVWLNEQWNKFRPVSNFGDKWDND